MAAHREQHFRWVWQLQSPPSALWPLVSNTDRFNRDCGYPMVVAVPPEPGEPPRPSNSRRLRARVSGVVVEWQELAFDWVAPLRYSVQRTYFRGPVAKMLMSCELTPNAGGTSVVYDMRLTPANWLGRLSLSFAIGKHARATTEKVFRRYDEFAQAGLRASQLAQKPTLQTGGAERLLRLQQELIESAAQPATLVAQLVEFIRSSDDLSAAQIRPYALADGWSVNRRDMLRLCLHATRRGLLDFSWDLICPHCRGVAAAQPDLAGVSSVAHCETCQIDFVTNFDQSIELTFHPNAAIRSVVRSSYCVGGPQVTPHVVAQHLLPPAGRQTLALQLSPGRYRVRSPGLAEQQAFRVQLDGARSTGVDLGLISPEEPMIAPNGSLTISNPRSTEQLAIVESIAWSDTAVTAAEVTSLQLFRDLFSREVLRPGEKFPSAP